MLSAGEEIRAAIAGAGGAISFETFMDLALYGEGGFYSGEGAAGRRGDFITSPEVGPLFGAVLARAVESWWNDLGQPASFTFVDAGAGPGTLARSMRAAAPALCDAIEYLAVELSATQRERHPDWVTSTATMPTAPMTGVIVANELLDNLPFRLFVMDGTWREAFVIADAEGAFSEVLLAAADLDQLDLPVGAPLGARVPVQQRACEWLTSSLQTLQHGRVVTIDYCSATTAGLAVRPWRQWLRTYRGHERGEHYLRSPGTQDITAEVAIDQLVRAVGDADAIRPQAQFLQRWGITELVDEGRRIWTEQAARPTVAALTMRSRVREAEALCDPGGLGEFVVAEFQR